MRTPLRLRRALAALSAGCAAASLLAAVAAAHPPVYKDAERAGPAGPPLRPGPEVVVEVDQACCAGPSRPQRLINGGVGYVGSVRGLGRPSYDGLWPPPGYGSYREHPLD